MSGDVKKMFYNGKENAKSRNGGDLKKSAPKRKSPTDYSLFQVSDPNKTDNGSEEDDQTVTEKENLALARLKGQCYCCGASDHGTNECPERDSKPKTEWAINQLNVSGVGQQVGDW